MEYFTQLQTLSPQQQTLFYTEFNSNKKSFAVAFLLCLFFGGLGVHKFYLDQPGKGLAYLLFFWTFIPSILAFINLFTMSSTIKNINNNLANKIIVKIN